MMITSALFSMAESLICSGFNEPFGDLVMIIQNGLYCHTDNDYLGLEYYKNLLTSKDVMRAVGVLYPKERKEKIEEKIEEKKREVSNPSHGWVRAKDITVEEQLIEIAAETESSSMPMPNPSYGCPACNRYEGSQCTCPLDLVDACTPTPRLKRKEAPNNENCS